MPRSESGSVSGDRAPAEPIVSVVIPIFNQAHYLASAIESVLAQTCKRHEVIVVDDGSTDDPAAIASRYPGVACVRQENSGTASARNRGIGESRGSHLVFLDADDRLLPHALEKGLNALASRPDCAFVFGLARKIGPDGSALRQPPLEERGYYAALLRRCPIWHPAAVLCRRFVFDQILFDTTMTGCSDYLFYLNTARRWPVYCHNEEVSEYRQHEANKSGNSAGMIRSLSAALRSQRRFVRSVPVYEAAYREGIKNCKLDYYVPALRQTWRLFRGGRDRKRARRDIGLLLRVTPEVLPRLAGASLYRWARRGLAG